MADGSDAPAIDTTITDRVYMDIGLCPDMLNASRTLGSKSALCQEPQSLGRVVIGLYGHAVPQTVANFMEAIRGGVYTSTTFNRILPGAYIQAGRQGSKRFGQVEAPSLPPNSELLSSSAYQIPHLRPGTVSLALGANDDESDLKASRGFRNTQFLITTGPGPVPSLDGENVVFGRVLDGMTTVSTVASVPTFSPNEGARQMNAVAKFLGDERAAKTAAKWGKPLKAVVITRAGVLS